MYIPIVCANCNQSIEIEADALGKTVECPLCRQPTFAEKLTPTRPVARPLLVAEEPLSLDDAPQLPAPVEKSNSPQTSHAKARRLPSALQAGIKWGLVVIVLVGVYLGYRWYRGDSDTWKAYHSPEGGFSIFLPENRRQEDILATGFANLGGKRTIATLPLSLRSPTGKTKRVNLEFSAGWIDLDAGKLRGVQFDQIAAPVLTQEANRLQGKPRLVSVVGFTSKGRTFDVSEYIIELEEGFAVLRIYLEKGDPRKRLFILSASGPELDAKDDRVIRFFNWFEPD